MRIKYIDDLLIIGTTMSLDMCAIWWSLVNYVLNNHFDPLGFPNANYTMSMKMFV